MAHTILIDADVQAAAGRRSLNDVLERREKWGAGYDEEKARIRRNERQMQKFEKQSAPSSRDATVRGRRTGRPAPPGARL